MNNIHDAVTTINNNIEEKYASLMEYSPAISDYVENLVDKWQSKTRSEIANNFPLIKHENKLSTWQEKFHLDPENIDKTQSIDDFIEFCKDARIPVHEGFWREVTSSKSRKNPQDKNQTKIRLLLEQWQKGIDNARGEWELGVIDALRERFLAKLEEILKTLQSLRESLENIGIDPGILVDLSKGNLLAKEVQQFMRWAKYLAEDQGVRSLCDLLGKIRQLELSERIERVKICRTSEIFVPDINSREEITGIRLGRELEHALSSELALLADEETSILFDLKYIESRLMCFDMQGLQTQQHYHEAEEDRAITEKEKQGPIILCIDTSGSMNGMPETVAKAVALFMSTKAKEQNRPCYLINFSTEIQTLNLTSDLSLADLMKFLGMSFHGGTDAAPALMHALGMMENEEFKKADLLIISDFVMGDLPRKILERIESQRIFGNKFYSLVVGAAYMSHRMETLFDQEWVFNPQNSSIHELINFQQRVNQMNA